MYLRFVADVTCICITGLLQMLLVYVSKVCCRCYLYMYLRFVADVTCMYLRFVADVTCICI